MVELEEEYRLHAVAAGDMVGMAVVSGLLGTGVAFNACRISRPLLPVEPPRVHAFSTHTTGGKEWSRRQAEREDRRGRRA